jgi:hypothetical protein
MSRIIADPSKWQMHPQSAAANAIMFDRTSGLDCEKCLEKCAKFQASKGNGLSL